MIKVENVSFKYRNSLVLSDVSVNFYDDKITALVGLNGAGKSTLIKLLIGYLKPICGSIVVENQDIIKMNAMKRLECISYVPQLMDLNYHFKAYEFVGLGLNTTNDNVDKAFKLVNAEKLKDRYVLELSGGERRLIYLARALATNSKWLILDEPTSNLDYKREIEFLDLLKNDLKKSIILSIHNPNLALKYADKIVLFEDNRIIGSYDVLNERESLFKALEEIYGKKIVEEIRKG